MNSAGYYSTLPSQNSKTDSTKTKNVLQLINIINKSTCLRISSVPIHHIHNQANLYKSLCLKLPSAKLL